MGKLRGGLAAFVKKHGRPKLANMKSGAKKKAQSKRKK